MHRIAVAVLLLAATSVAVAADFGAGWRAYGRGDYATALREWRPLAKQGNADAQDNLGVMYNNGEGVPKDDHKAVFWFRKAAEQKHANAQNNLGAMYNNGEGVPEDDHKAVFWFRKAAEQGHANAQNNLGAMYYYGEGVPQNNILAYAWINLAAEQENELAKESRSNLQQLMTSNQVAEGRRRSREFMVHEAQRALAALGYDPGRLEGRASQRTTAAVRRFQRENGMTPNGQISHELLAELRTRALDTPRSNGSGFVVGDEGEIVTNYHVVEGCTRITVNRPEALQDQRTGGPAKVRKTDPESDLALLVASSAAGTAVTFSQSPRAQIGEEVTVAGYPLHGVVSLALNVTHGYVTAMVGKDDNPERFQFDANIQPGNSGGPVFDSAGNVIGVVVSRIEGGNSQSINFAIEGAIVRGFLDIHGVKYRRRASEARLTSKKRAGQAPVSTVVVHCWK